MSVQELNISLKTDPGQVRPYNQDSVGYWIPETTEQEHEFGHLYLVADGVGGAASGEVASQFSIDNIRSLYPQQTGTIPEKMLSAVEQTNIDLRQKIVAEMETGQIMATTLVAVVLHTDTAYFLNVGDSRGYHYHDGKLIQITHDHSLVQRLINEGAITEAEAEVHPKRNVIFSSLGPVNDPATDQFEVKLSTGDRLLLCSDGLIRHVNDSEIAEVLQEHSAEDASTILINLANARGGSDNISIAIVDVPTIPESETVAENAPEITPPTDELTEDDVSEEKSSVKKSGKRIWLYLILFLVVQFPLWLWIFPALQK